MRAFVTGATGMLGRAIAIELREQGHQVVALVRPESDTTLLRKIGVELSSGSLANVGSDSTALDGCDALVHAAGLTKPSADWEEYRRINVDATRELFEAAAQAGVKRAVHVSSASVYGTPDQVAGRRIDETAPTDSALADWNFYARSKRQAEEVVRACHTDGRFRVTIVRPCFVYGEGDRLVVPRLVRMVQARVCTTIGSGRNDLALVYTGNVAEGVVLALTSTGSACRAYNLTNDFPVTQRDLFRFAAEILGRRRVIIPVPGFVARGLIRASLPIRERGLAFLALRNPFVSDLARREIGWAPRTQHDVALSRAIQWHLAHAAGNDPL